MIAWQPDAALPALQTQFGGDPFGALALAGRMAYDASYAFAGAWRVGNAALLGRLNGTFALSGTLSAADCAELNRFLPMIGCGRWQTSDRVTCIGAKRRRTGVVLRHVGTADRRTIRSTVPDARTATAILADSPSPWMVISQPDAFYVDLSHRMRHGHIRARAVRAADGTAAACALTWAETDRIAVLAVACRPAFRGHGYASQALRALCAELHAAGKVPTVMTGDACVPFYRQNGFEPAGKWIEWETEDAP